MTDPKPWTVDGAPESVRALLVAARAEEPDSKGRERALVALGVGAAVSGMSAQAAGAALGGASGAKGAATASGFAFAVKWGLVGALGAVATFGAAHGVSVAFDAIRGTGSAAERAPRDVPRTSIGPGPLLRPTPPPAEARATTEPGSLPPPLPPALAGSVNAETSSVSAQPAATVASPDAPPRADILRPPLPSDAPTNPLPGSPTASGDTVLSRRMMEEVAAIDRARGLLARGDVTGTLAALDAYAARFPDRRFEPEALYLRMEAAGRAGDGATARATASELVQLFPTAPQAARARAVLAPGR